MTTKADLCQNGCQEVNYFNPMARTEAKARPITVQLCPKHAATDRLAEALKQVLASPICDGPRCPRCDAFADARAALKEAGLDT